MTPTSWSVVRYVVHGAVGKCTEEKRWIDVRDHVNEYQIKGIFESIISVYLIYSIH